MQFTQSKCLYARPTSANSPCDAQRLAEQPPGYQFVSQWYDPTEDNTEWSPILYTQNEQFATRPSRWSLLVGWLAGCLTSQKQASVSQGRICSDNFTCCHTEIEVADQTFHLTQSQYTDTGPTSPSADPITPGAWQGSHWSVNFEITGMTGPRKNPGANGIQTRDLPLSRRLLLVGCLTSQQHASVSQGRICSDNFTCCHTEIEVADQTFHLIQSQYTDTRPTSPSADPITPGAWQGSHWSANF